MSGRKASTVSILSDRPRKFSVDRHQRQAELSARIEEGRPSRPPLAREEDVTVSFRQDFFSQPSLAATTLTRADTFPSPLEVHPGRVRGESIAAKKGRPFEDYFFNEVKPWAEPTVEEQDDIERRYAVVERAETDPIDGSYAQNQIRLSASHVQTTSNPIRLLADRVRGRSSVKHSALEGLRASSGVITAHANALLLKNPAVWDKRRQLAVFDYETKKGNVFACNAFNAFPSKLRLESHLNELEKAPALRIVRICNNEEAVNYLDDAFAISPPGAHNDERGFRKWMQIDRDQRGASNMTIRWRPGYDAHRAMICSAFGLDFGPLLVQEGSTQRISTEKEIDGQSPQTPKLTIMPHRKRIAIYMQRALSSAVPGPRVTQFNSRAHNLNKHALDDTLIICEYASDDMGALSNSAYLRALSPINIPEHHSGSVNLIASAMRLVFEEVAWQWEKQIHIVHERHAEIENMIYARPADASHATRVWAMSQRLHSMQKLITRHLDLMETFKEDFKSFAELDEEQDWLDDILEDLHRLSNAIRGDYIEPLEHMIDLMYKSITIRDSSLSLQLNSSLWRLSWITFIFLPMTFLVGFFGMNVDTFKTYPAIKWYFVGLIPLFGVVFVCWLSFRELDIRAKKKRAKIYDSKVSTQGSKSIAKG